MSEGLIQGWGGRAVALLVCLAGATSAWAQIPAPTKVEAKIDDVTVMMQKTPEFAASVSDNKKDGKKREWLEIEVKFETESDSKIGVIPELMISYYVAVKGAASQVLTGSYTYSNIVDDEDSYAIVYVSPHGLTALAGEPDRFRENDVLSWGVEVLYQGRVVAAESKSGGAWWTSTSAPRNPGLLLPKEKTPFRMLWIDRHVELKEN